MRIEQSVSSYPTPRRTPPPMLIFRRDLKTSDSVIVGRAVNTAVDTDRSRSRWSFRTFELIVVKCPCSAISMKRHYNIFINEMIGLYLVPTRLRTTTKLSTNQPSLAVNLVNQ